MPIGNVDNPIPGTLEDSITCSQAGLMLKVGSTAGRLDKTDGVTDVAIGVSVDESERDSSGLVTTAANVSYYPLTGVRYCATAAVQWRSGQSAYLHATDGYVDNVDSGSDFCVGAYAGTDMSSAATAGDLVPINCSTAVSST